MNAKQETTVGTAMLTEEEFRELVGRLIKGHVPPTAQIKEVVVALEDRVAWLEKAWFDCHEENLRHRQRGWLQHKAALAGQSFITDDPHAETYVMGLLGPGFCFGQTEDYQLAIQLAVRAYRDGIAGKTLFQQHVNGEPDNDPVASTSP